MPIPRFAKLAQPGHLGTSQGVAQSVMRGNVCNSVPVRDHGGAGGQGHDDHEVALPQLASSRPVDSSSGSDALVDPAYLTEGRVFVRVIGEGGPGPRRQAARTIRWRKFRLLGLPVPASPRTARRPRPRARPSSLKVILPTDEQDRRDSRVGSW